MEGESVGGVWGGESVGGVGEVRVWGGEYICGR